MTTTTLSRHVPIQVLPGVCPSTDSTGANTKHFTAADKIRFVKGKPQKLNGWTAILLNGTAISGTARTIFSSNIGEKVQTVIGSNEALYAVIGSDTSDITPFLTTTNAIANSLDTLYGVLPSQPIETTAGSNEITVADLSTDRFVAGDAYTLSGAVDVGGIPAADINKTHIVREVRTATNKIVLKVNTNATSTVGAGGGVITRSCGIIAVNITAHTFTNGQRIKINAAADTGGILAAQINTEHTVRNVSTNSLDIVTNGTATSSVTGGGGASTTYQQGIAAGREDETSGQGYGMGKYGVGLYGTALTSDNGRRLPRIWFCDQFGDKIIATPGNGLGVYEWDGNLVAAPTLIANAPTEVNYAFVSDNILVTLGADDERNKIKSSDIGDFTNWTASSTNQVFEDYIEGAGSLWTHVSLNGTNLIFTTSQCYTFRYIGLPFIWEIKFKDNIGCIAPMARVVVKGVAYWMGEDNFYMWKGGNVEVVPSNSSSETTLLNYVFQNINRGQSSKCFAWYNKRYDEIWFHYPSEGSIEVDRVARYHVTERHWTPDTFDRLAAEYPSTNLQYPRLINSSGTLYRHEVGFDDNDAAMAWSLTTNLRDFGTDNVLQTSLIPDSVQTSDISVTIDAYSFPQSQNAKNTKTVTVSPTTEEIPLDIDGRFLRYTFSGEALSQNWIMGSWQEPIQPSSRSQ